MKIVCKDRCYVIILCYANILNFCHEKQAWGFHLLDNKAMQIVLA